MKPREKSTSEVELSTICRQFKLTAPDGKKRETDNAVAGRTAKISRSRLVKKVVSKDNFLPHSNDHVKKLDNQGE